MVDLLLSTGACSTMMSIGTGYKWLEYGKGLHKLQQNKIKNPNHMKSLDPSRTRVPQMHSSIRTCKQTKCGSCSQIIPPIAFILAASSRSSRNHTLYVNTRILWFPTPNYARVLQQSFHCITNEMKTWASTIQVFWWRVEKSLWVLLSWETFTSNVSIANKMTYMSLEIPAFVGLLNFNHFRDDY
jgi:hypothetical protein